MSYSVSTQCYSCAKQETCTDAKKITDCVHKDIHSASYEQGHQGGGIVVISCAMMVNKTERTKYFSNPVTKL